METELEHERAPTTPTLGIDEREDDDRPIVLRMRGVRRVYEMPTETIAALDGVDLDIRKGEIVLLLGPSGSGKTTLLNVVSALDNPSGGEYVFDGEPVPSGPNELVAPSGAGSAIMWRTVAVPQRWNHSRRMAKAAEAMTSFRRGHIGYVFQFFNLLMDLTVLENVLLVQELSGVRDEQRARELLDLVGLEGLHDRFPTEISGGQQQRVAIARSLAKKPTMLLGDEPTGNLDTQTSAQVMQVLVDACRKEGITALLVTHDPSLATYATRVIHMDSGRLVKDEPGGLAGLKGKAREVARGAKEKAEDALEKAGEAARAASGRVREGAGKVLGRLADLGQGDDRGRKGGD